MIRTGKLPYVRDGRRKLLDRIDLDAWIESNKFIEDDAGTFRFPK